MSSAVGGSGADGSRKIEAKHLVFFGEGKNDYRFEEPNWWVNQIRQLADFYLDHEFGDEIDYHAFELAYLACTYTNLLHPLKPAGPTHS